jgi:hypothetical protein
VTGSTIGVMPPGEQGLSRIEDWQLGIGNGGNREHRRPRRCRAEAR